MSEITSQLPPAPPEGQLMPVSAVLPQGSAPGERRLRLWPGVVFVALEWLFIVVPGWVMPGTMFQFMSMLVTPLVASLAVVCWWLFASRLRWQDRFLDLVACATAGAVVAVLRDPSMQVMGLIMYALPAVTTAWVCWLLITPFLRWPVRRVGLLTAFVLAWGFFALVRFEGIYGNMSATLVWRWSPTAEDLFRAEHAARARVSASPVAEDLLLQPGDWPGFRGSDRDGRLKGVQIATDWKQHPPRELWRQRVGPGWSSLAVIGRHLYTQEQRDESEVVVCYDTETGKEVWVHEDQDRFTELVAGPGPRATPTFHKGKLYVQGAAGKLNCLDAATGKPLWRQDIVADSGAKVPQWGYAASPLVAQGIVTVFAGGPEGKSVLGYEAESGKLAWSAGEGKLSYCSPQLAHLGGVEQVLLTSDAGLTSFHPTGGKVLWQHSWPVDGVARIVQPALIGEGDVLLGTGFTAGTRRVHLNHTDDNWKDEEVWTSRAIKPYYNDLVVYKDHLYGFDGEFLTCVNLEDGKSRWRARGYGNGQVLLLADQGVLLVLSEKGVVALVSASPEGHKELGRFQAIKGKTWNHPVVAHGKLFVRNGEEMACFKLAESDGTAGQ